MLTDAEITRLWRQWTDAEIAAEGVPFDESEETRSIFAALDEIREKCLALRREENAT